MKNDIDAQFLCKDCSRYSQCRYYHNRKEDSYICKYFEFHLAVPDKEPCEDATLKDIFCMGCEYKEQQPCEDAISRQAVIDGIKRYFHDEYYQRTSIQDCRDCLIEDVIKDLPSVTPIRPKGGWIKITDEETAYSTTWHYECSKCGKHNTCLDGNPDFCPGCGADMRGEEG